MNIADIFNYDFRRFDTENSISSLRRYLATMEAQIEVAYVAERNEHDAKGPDGNDEEDYDIHRQIGEHIDIMYQDELIPAMRYSLVVLLHTVFETRLRSFAEDLRKERKISLGSDDMAGSEIDKVRRYLTKALGLDLSSVTEWSRLACYQRVRNKLTHTNGFVEPLQKSDFLRDNAQASGLSIDDNDRIRLTRGFCEEYLNSLDLCFRQLFALAQWSDGSPRNP